jgi:predicted RNase H-like nuclease (RuvC/YqgF family)
MAQLRARSETTTGKKVFVGIDPGIHCGYAVWDKAAQQFRAVGSYQLWELFQELFQLNDDVGEALIVHIENPNTFIPFRGTAQKEHDFRAQGAGAVKQTYKHIIEFLDAHKIEYVTRKLQGSLKKVSSEYFKKHTGWKLPTNEHGRDAAMLVWKY